MPARLICALGLLITSTACDGGSECDDVDPPACDAGWEPIVKSYNCHGGDGTISGITEYLCVPEGIGDPCDANADDCGDGLLCTSEPDQQDVEYGTCLPTCITLEGDCELLGYEWECVTTSNGPDVCAADYAQ